jgi:hypothetical protein
VNGYVGSEEKLARIVAREFRNMVHGGDRIVTNWSDLAS